jgi:hypothetical protein
VRKQCKQHHRDREIARANRNARSRDLAISRPRAPIETRDLDRRAMRATRRRVVGASRRDVVRHSRARRARRARAPGKKTNDARSRASGRRDVAVGRDGWDNAATVGITRATVGITPRRLG